MKISSSKDIQYKDYVIHKEKDGSYSAINYWGEVEENGFGKVKDAKDWIDEEINEVQEFIADDWGDDIYSSYEGDDVDVIMDVYDKVYDAAFEKMKDFGFEEDEISDYLFSEFEFIGDDMFRIEIRAELSYDSLMELSGVLDKIVSRYDPNSYFEAVDSGIIEAYVTRR